MTRSWRELTQCDVEKKKKKRLHTYIVYFPLSLKKMLLTSQSHLPHAAFFVAAKSLLPQGKSSRHQTEAGNVLLCLEDEPYKGRAFLKKTRCIIVISSAHKASIIAVIQTQKTKPSYAFQNSLQEDPEKRNRGACLDHSVLSLSCWTS